VEVGEYQLRPQIVIKLSLEGEEHYGKAAESPSQRQIQELLPDSSFSVDREIICPSKC
jgi:hypothetical protein